MGLIKLKQYIWTTGYCPAIEKNEVVIYAPVWMGGDVQYQGRLSGGAGSMQVQTRGRTL